MTNRLVLLGNGLGNEARRVRPLRCPRVLTVPADFAVYLLYCFRIGDGPAELLVACMLGL
jgi:hypothetical protein